jgi:hypothetical protein
VRDSLHGEGKTREIWEVRDGSHMEQGQDRELYPILHLIGEKVLHCSTPPNPIKATAQKTNERDKGAEK